MRLIRQGGAALGMKPGEKKRLGKGVKKLVVAATENALNGK
jgi:hypothetical protein